MIRKYYSISDQEVQQAELNQQVAESKKELDKQDWTSGERVEVEVT